MEHPDNWHEVVTTLQSAEDAKYVADCEHLGLLPRGSRDPLPHPDAPAEDGGMEASE